MREFQDVDDSRKADGFTTDELSEGDRLDRYVDDLIAGRYPNPVNAPDEPVPFTLLWAIDRDAPASAYVGSVCVNHRLTSALKRWGGHIAYNVRPSLRRRGHATAMLAAALPIAHAAGVDRALLTVHVNNTGSRRVIDANGGELVNIDGSACYYWIPTRGTAPVN
ncbi:GNAT family N-acetyltransferase [Actinomadura sp. WMMB 499]|nr:GNAT family N-acetyltransferase [Actinomadura sp. WMMB 499]